MSTCVGSCTGDGCKSAWWISCFGLPDNWAFEKSNAASDYAVALGEGLLGNVLTPGPGVSLLVWPSTCSCWATKPLRWHNCWWKDAWWVLSWIWVRLWDKRCMITARTLGRYCCAVAVELTGAQAWPWMTVTLPQHHPSWPQCQQHQKKDYTRTYSWRL